MTSSTEKYNGWTNYATWGVALVLDNDQGSQEYVAEHMSQVREDVAQHANVTSGIWTEQDALRFEMADFLKDYVDELCGLDGNPDGLEIPEPTLMARQVMQAGLAEVNWDEIAESIISES